MDSNKHKASEAQRPPGDTLRQQWPNPGRKRFWAIVGVLFYTLLGFFVVPAVVKNSIISLIEDDLHRSVQIKKVEFNPYVFSLAIQGFEMDDSDGTSLAAFDELFVNFQLSSLFQWAWTFEEISLQGFDFFFERFSVGDTRLSRLLADVVPEDLGEAVAGDKGGLPRLLIHNLSMSDGKGMVRDNVPPTPVELPLGPINISIHELNTLPGRHGDQNVTIQLPNDASLHWEGSLTLAPLDSEGELEIENSDLNQTISYLKAMLPLESMSAKLSSRFHYRIHMDTEGALEAEIDGLEIELDELAVTGLSPATDFLNITKLSMHGGTLRYPEQILQFSSLRINQPRFTAWMSENGKLSLEQLRAQAKPESEAVAHDTPWQLGLDELIIEGGSLDLADQSVNPAVEIGVRGLQIKMSQISNQDGGLFPLDLSGNFEQGGNFGLEGKLALFPELSFRGGLHTQAVPLAMVEPYAQQLAHILIESGTLDSNMEFTVPANMKVSAAGALKIPGLEIKDSKENKRLLGWEMMDIDRFEFDAGSLHLSRLLFDQPFARIVISEDLSTNLSGLLVENKGPAEAAQDQPIAMVIGGIRVNDGTMDFSDLSLPLPFATHIAKMDGTISTIATDSSEPANIKLEGQVNEFGLARIDGTINVLDPIRHTDMTLEFRNLSMSRLSPYSASFAGREIDEGTLDLDLNYAIAGGQLHGENDVVISDLLLGDKVDHPDAASLPLDLAVALLKDANGVIDLELPVEGDVNDPEFKIGGVVLQAITGLITKIVSAPFALLGSLIGLDAQDLGEFQFLAGRADLTPPELEKITQLEKALQQRPELVVEISGVTDPIIDEPALKYIHLRDTVREMLGDEANETNDDTLMLDVEIRSLLETLFVERYPGTSLDSLKAELMAPPADDPEGKPALDELAWSGKLRDQLLASEAISEQDLTNLAQARAEVIRAAFLASGQISESRVVIAQPEKVESGDGEWVTLPLAVAQQ